MAAHVHFLRRVVYYLNGLQFQVIRKDKLARKAKSITKFQKPFYICPEDNVCIATQGAFRDPFKFSIDHTRDVGVWILRLPESQTAQTAHEQQSCIRALSPKRDTEAVQIFLCHEGATYHCDGELIEQYALCTVLYTPAGTWSRSFCSDFCLDYASNSTTYYQATRKLFILSRVPQILLL